MYAIKGLTAWDNIPTGPFKTMQEAKEWLKSELIRQNWDKRYNKLLSNSEEFNKYADNMIYEVLNE